MPFASIYNRNERAVFDKAREASTRFPDLAVDEELLADASCLALNALPAHYVRHAADVSFHISDTQHAKETRAVSDRVE
jgi:competence protein ComFB